MRVSPHLHIPVFFFLTHSFIMENVMVTIWSWIFQRAWKSPSKYLLKHWNSFMGKSTSEGKGEFQMSLSIWLRLIHVPKQKQIAVLHVWRPWESGGYRLYLAAREYILLFQKRQKAAQMGSSLKRVKPAIPFCIFPSSQTSSWLHVYLNYLHG